MPWSDWQDPFETTRTHAFAAYNMSSDDGGTGGTQASQLADLPDRFAAAVAGTGASGVYPLGALPPMSLREIVQATALIETSPPFDDHDAAGTGAISQVVVSITGGDDLWLGFPDPLADLEYGEDPDTGLSYEYESDAMVFVQWLDWTVTFSSGFADDYGVVQAVSGNTWEFHDGWEPYISWRLVDFASLNYEQVVADVAANSGAVPIDDWPDPGIGTELLKYNLPVPLDADTSLTTDLTCVVPLAAGVLDDESFTLVMQPDFMMESMPTVYAPPSVPGTAKESAAFGALTANVTQPFPETVVRSPRWRYWIPVKWHVIGGHYAPIGSVGLKIFTPPHGWVDIVDGPA